MRPALLPLLLVTLPSCAPSYRHVHHAHVDAVNAGFAVLELIGGIVELAAESSNPEPVVYEQVMPAPPPPAPVPFVHFNAAAARRELSKQDLSRCGAPPGRGHATITYEPSGVPARVTIDAPTGLSTEATACIANALGAVDVAPFTDGPVTIGVGWSVASR
jgi:hypothetical protein